MHSLENCPQIHRAIKGLIMQAYKFSAIKIPSTIQGGNFKLKLLLHQKYYSLDNNLFFFFKS